jgi:hypothetical protein
VRATGEEVEVDGDERSGGGESEGDLVGGCGKNLLEGGAGPVFIGHRRQRRQPPLESGGGIFCAGVSRQPVGTRHVAPRDGSLSISKPGPISFRE